MKAVLILEDGFALSGKVFAGSAGIDEIYGEVVFNTSITGYQEIATDPSYKGQIVALTHPMIGNYGTNDQDMESNRPQIEGLIVKEYSTFPHNWRSKRTLRDFLDKHGVIGIEGVDTRALTKHIREAGAMKGAIVTGEIAAALSPYFKPGVDANKIPAAEAELMQNVLARVKAYPGLVGRDLVKYVTCRQPYQWNESGRYHVVVMDFGVKYNILRMLEKAGCRLTVVPAYITAREILSLQPDGIFLSNGPGDPGGLTAVVTEIKKILGKRPIFGICLGHQLLGLACGLETFKLKFGHRGGNHPVKNLRTGRVEITSQNHGFCVKLGSKKRALGRSKSELKYGFPVAGGLEVTHINLNDYTLEGMESRVFRFFSVQYHPEAAPGPHDSRYLFERFVEMMKGGQD